MIWVSGIHGCQFDTPSSSVTLGAAQLCAVVAADRGAALDPMRIQPKPLATGCIGCT